MLRSSTAQHSTANYPLLKISLPQARDFPAIQGTAGKVFFAISMNPARAEEIANAISMNPARTEEIANAISIKQDKMTVIAITKAIMTH